MVFMSSVELNKSKKKIFDFLSRKRDLKTLREIIENCVLQGSMVYTDILKANPAYEIFNLEHKMVRYSKCFKALITGVHTKTVEI